MGIYEHFFWNYTMFHRKPWAWKVGLGGIMPDLVYLAIFLPKLFTYKSFGEWMRDPLWDAAWNSLAAKSAHSFVIWGLTFLLLWLLFRKQSLWEHTFPVAIGWGLHVAADALTHVSDSYPIFYPLSAYRFPSPVSYWERAYYAREYFMISHSLMAGILLFWLVRRIVRLMQKRGMKNAPPATTEQLNM